MMECIFRKQDVSKLLPSLLLGLVSSKNLMPFVLFLLIHDLLVEYLVCPRYWARLREIEIKNIAKTGLAQWIECRPAD